MDRLTELLESCRAQNARLIEDNKQLRAELAALREALRVYGRHLDSCGDDDAYNNAEMRTCGCGFDAARGKE